MKFKTAKEFSDVCAPANRTMSPAEVKALAPRFLFEWVRPDGNPAFTSGSITRNGALSIETNKEMPPEVAEQLRDWISQYYPKQKRTGKRTHGKESNCSRPFH